MNFLANEKKLRLTHASLDVWNNSAQSEYLLLFVHGAHHGAWCYEAYGRYFADLGVNCAAIDLRGHGDLPQDDLFVQSGQKEMADDVVEAVAALGRKAIIVGHSAGGAVAASAATKTRCEGMILLAPAPPGQLVGLHPLPLVPADAPVAPPDKETTHRRFFPNLTRAESDKLWQNLVPESPTLMNDRRALRVRIDRTRISGPSIVIAAGKDDATMHSYGQDYETARFYGAEYYFVEEAGHCFMLEPDWEREAQIIRRWIWSHFGIGGANA